jgi:DNA-binding NarL/FixJ family response regulator
MSDIRILIADDHALVREGIRAMLKIHEGIEVVGEAPDGLEAIKQVEKLQPDIVLMDISMPGLGGLEATLEIRNRYKEVKILILSQYDDPEYVARFLKAGVSGYILKKALGSDLVSAIRAVAEGGSYLYPSVAVNVINGYLGRDKPQVEDPLQKVTKREHQVLKLIAEGHSSKEIAEILNVSVKTVVAHQTNISEKLGIHSRAGLMKYAFQKGLVK